MSKNGRIKLILVDDEVLMLSLLTDFLNTKSDIDVLTSFYEGENFIEYLENCHKYHEDWLKHTNKEKVITLDGNINTKLNPNVIDNWVSDIFEFLKI